MNIRQSEGIVLHTTAFQDFTQIVTLFSRDTGYVKMIVKGEPLAGEHANLDSLMKGFFVFEENSGEIFRCHNFSITNTYSKVREQSSLLRIAQDLLQVVRISQYPGVASPQLYQLLSMLLDKIPDIQQAESLPTILRIKIWKHEGIFDGDCFPPLERALVLQLAECRSLEKLLQIPLPHTLQMKIEQLFLFN